MEVKEKIKGMQKYIPCLKLLIGNLEKNPDKAEKLKKMQYLLDMLTKKDLSIKLETLDRCENVLRKMYGVEKISESSSDCNGESNVKEVAEDSQISFGEGASSNGENDLNGQADSNGCETEEVAGKDDSKDTENSVEKMKDPDKVEKMDKASAVEEAEGDDCQENNVIQEAEIDENTEGEKSDIVEKSPKQAVESLETSESNDSVKTDSKVVSQNEENREVETDAKNESMNIEETELLQTSCELEMSATESQPSKLIEELVDEQSEKENRKEDDTIPDKSVTQNSTADSSEIIESEQVENKSADDKSTTPVPSATESQSCELMKTGENESTEKQIGEETVQADCNNDDCDMDIDEELTNSTVTTAVDPLVQPLPSAAPIKETTTSAQKSTEKNTEQPVKPSSAKAGVVDLTSDDSDSETSKTNKVTEKIVIKPTNPTERPAVVYILENDKLDTPAKSTPAKKTPERDPLKDPLQCDKVSPDAKGSKIATIDLLDSDSDDESGKKSKTPSPPAKNNLKMPTPKPMTEKPMFTIASVQSISNTQTQTEKRHEVEKTLLGVVKTAQSTMHHAVPQKHNVAVRVHLDKFIADLMYEKNRVNLCLQKLQALLPIDMYRQVKRVIQTFCSEPVHDPSLPAPSPFCHRIKVYPEKLQFVMRTLFYYNASISVVGYKLFSLDKKSTVASPARPLINVRSTQSLTAPRPGQSPSAPRPGQSPSTPRPGQTQTISRPVQNSSTPKSVQNTSSPRPGQTSSNPRSLLVQPNRTTPQKPSPQKQPAIRPVQQKQSYVSPQKIPQAIYRIPAPPSTPALSSKQTVSLPTSSLANDDLLAPMKSQSVPPESLEPQSQPKQRRKKRRNDDDDDDDDDDENYVPQGYFSGPDDTSEEQPENPSRRTSLQRASKVRCQKYLELERSIDDETYIRAAEATFAKVKPQKSPGTQRKAVKRIRPPRPPKKKPEPEPEPEPLSDGNDTNPDDEKDADYKESGPESDSEPSAKRKRNDEMKAIDPDEDDDDCEPPPKLDTKTINFAKNTTKAYHCRSQYINRCVICHEKLHIRRIVSHYVKNHRDREVYISRITKGDLMKLQSETMSFGFLSGSKTQGSQYVAYCIFCQQENTLSVEKWWEHYTRHTGEYEYECSACGARRSARQQLNRHVNIECTQKDMNPTVIGPEDFDPEMTRIDAYVCLLCRYIQLRMEPMLKHLHTEHELSIVADEIPEGTFQMVNLFRIEHNYYESNEFGDDVAPPVNFHTDDMSYMICNMLATAHNTSGEQTPAIGSEAEKAPADDRSQSPEMIIPEVIPPMDLIKNLNVADSKDRMEEGSGEPIPSNDVVGENESSKEKSRGASEANSMESEKTDAAKDSEKDVEMAIQSDDGSSASGQKDAEVSSEINSSTGGRQKPAVDSEINSSTGEQQEPAVDAEINEASATAKDPEEPSGDVTNKTDTVDSESQEVAVSTLIDDDVSKNLDSESQEVAVPAPADDEVSKTSDTATVEEPFENAKSMEESMEVDDSEITEASASQKKPEEPSEDVTDKTNTVATDSESQEVGVSTLVDDDVSKNRDSESQEVAVPAPADDEVSKTSDTTTVEEPFKNTKSIEESMEVDDSEMNEASATENEPEAPSEHVTDKTNTIAVDSESQKVADTPPTIDEISKTSDIATAEETSKTSKSMEVSMEVDDSDQQTVPNDPADREEADSLPNETPQKKMSLLSELKSKEELTETATERIFQGVANSLVESMLDSTQTTALTSESTSDLPEAASMSSDSVTAESGSEFMKSNDAPDNVDPMEPGESQPTETLSEIENFIVNTSVADTECYGSGDQSSNGEATLTGDVLAEPLETNLSTDGDNAVDGMSDPTAIVDKEMEQNTKDLCNDADVEMADGEKESC